MATILPPKRWKTEYIVLIVAFILFLISLSRYCMHGEPRTVMSDDSEQFGLSLYDGMEIEQTLTITEEMDWRQGEYSLLFAPIIVENGETADSEIQFRLEQNQEILDEEVISLSDLASMQKLLDGPLDEGVYVSIPLDFTKLSEGRAILSLTIEGVAEGEVSLVCGVDYYGFGETIVNGNSLGMTLFQKYDYHIINDEYQLRLLCYILVVLCMIILCFLLIGKEESKKRCYAVFAILTGMFLAIFYIYDSSVMLEPTYAEAVTNFMKFAREESFLKNFLITDAGYLPLFPRLITLLFIKVLRLPAADALYFMQMTACILCSMMWAFFCLYPFKKYVSLPLRVIFCMLVMAVCFHQETLFFTNFPYWGILLILLIMLSDMKAWSKVEFWTLTGFGALICLSKGAYAVILPFMLLYLCFFYSELDKRQKIYGFSMAGTAFLQILYSFGGSGDGGNWIRAEQLGQVSYLLKLLCKSFVDIISYLCIWLGEYIRKLGAAFGIIAMAAVILLIVGFVKKLVIPKFHKEKVDEKWMHFYTMFLFLAITAVFYRVTTKVVSDSWTEVFSATYEQIGNKYEIFCDVAGLLLLMLGISYMPGMMEKIKYEKNLVYNGQNIGVAILFMVFCITSPRLSLAGFCEVEVSDSRTYSGALNVSWSQTKDIIDRDAFFIPVRGDWWSYSRNITVYQVGTETFFEESKGTNLGMMEEGYHSFYTLEDGMPSENLIEVWIHRPNRITGTPYQIRLLDAQGNILQEVPQFGGTCNSKAGFVLDVPVNGVKTIQFFDCDGNEIYIDDYICWVSAY